MYTDTLTLHFSEFMLNLLLITIRVIIRVFSYF